VSSRFVSQTELDEAAANRASSSSTTNNGAPGAAKEEEEYDPRSLYERLQAHKQAKDEKYDEMFKLSNQFRGIDEGESEFLSQVAQQKKQEEDEKRRLDYDQLKAFR
ncbi:hypothetical protein BCV70DRAFT_153451, partial [Testicularia cyperi]